MQWAAIIVMTMLWMMIVIDKQIVYTYMMQKESCGRSWHPWLTLILKKKESLRLASIDDFIYAIGGQYSGTQFMKQFDIVEKKWEALPGPPVQGYGPYVYRDIQWSVPIPYEGKRHVYSAYRVHNELTLSVSRVPQMVTHSMFEYYPVTSCWQILLTEETVYFMNPHMVPTLFATRGNVYRVT